MTNGEVFVWELLGTATLILLGVGVVANVTLRRSLGRGGGWLLISFGWGFAVFTGASVSAPSGAHLNPAVTLGLAVAGRLDWDRVPVYVAAQLLGAIVGATLGWLVYKLQFDTHDDPSGTRGIFCTAPTVPGWPWNLLTEVVATLVLVVWILLSPAARAGEQGVPQFGNSALGYAAVAFVVVAIGASLGGPTGYAINPARDLGPRIVYALAPIRGKGGAEWGYAWVPVVGPLVGGALAGLLYLALPTPA
ncbi:glycerol uptake facilitator protein [Streptoalloteichus tenebrarius]|uniref:Glycerol uptake facilitator protein n=1 Tax=Streptoalloteichus tenebrarius (strain ATCC 17920 / DSM 40477 / JCM 4838 / CBS 697.72 / NBRC 16177 / NCIMB 11028 / NRRL B-12390 / A12253. 1 / ISP 5477) TaxID=1933 RepID=A0ABT1HY54_STRSD|nr:MIP/aquaporin family protein [Streptoalloteichus tenebrarius]MCP2260456.1 glycerol uptake facilitator protein [Streptoalloteichus tenebrarius]BFF02748.1 MIP/aquaporin family protein [Streptoalloteichus tenebrarius]